MTIYNKPDAQIFAKEAKPGEITTFPDITRGWGVTLDTTNGIPPMEFFNALQNRTDQALAYLMQRGVAEWREDLEYPKFAITILNGQVFFAKQQNINKNPLSYPDVWVNSFAQKANVDDVYNKQEIDELLSSNSLITHLTIKEAQEDDNSSRNIVRTLQRNFAEFIKISDLQLYNSFIDELKFTDVAGNLFVAKIGDNVSTKILDLQENSSISVQLQFLMSCCEYITLDKNYLLQDYVYLVSGRTLDLNGFKLTSAPSNVRMFLGAKDDNQKGGYSATNSVNIINGTLDKNGSKSEQNMGTIMSLYHCYNINIRNISFLNVKNDHSIEISGCSNVFIDDCIFKNYIATTRDDVEHIQIESMISSKNSPAYGPYDNTVSQHIYIRRCTFGDDNEAYTIGAAVGNHSDSKGVHDIHFLENKVTNCRLAGVRLIGEMSNIFIRANSFFKCTALLVHASPKASPKNIYFKENFGEHLYLPNLPTKNRYENFIRIDSSPEHPAENIVVSDNVFKDLNPARLLDFLRFEEAKDIIIENNMVESVRHSIFMTSAINMRLRSNVIKNISGNFILFKNASDEVLVKDNTFDGCDADTGIYCNAGKNLVIDSNTFKNCSGNVIHLTEDFSGFRISNNFIDNFSVTRDGSTGIKVIIAHDGVIYNNKFLRANTSKYSIDISKYARNVTTYNNYLEQGSAGYIKNVSGSALKMASPSGNLYNVSVSDDGILTTELV